MPSFNDDHLGFSGPELNGANAIHITAAGGKPFSLHNAVSFESTATMAHLPVDDTVTRAVGVDGSGNLVNTSLTTFSSEVRVDVAGDETGLHLAGNHDNTNHHGGKLRMTKFAADKATGKFSTVMYQDGETQQGDTVLVSGCTVSSDTRGFKFQAFKTSPNFDDIIDSDDVDTLGYITRNGFNCTSGEYMKDGTQITYSDLSGTISTSNVGDTQITDAKIAAMAASKLTGTVTNAQIATGVSATKLTTGTIPDARISSAIARVTALDAKANSADVYTQSAVDAFAIRDDAADQQILTTDATVFRIRTQSDDAAKLPQLVLMKNNAVGSTVANTFLKQYDDSLRFLTNGHDEFHFGNTTAAKITDTSLDLKSGSVYKINGTQITYSDLTGTIATAQVGDTQITDGKIAAMAATKLTGTIDTARIPNLAASKITTGTLSDGLLNATISRTDDVYAKNIVDSMVAAKCTKVGNNIVTGTWDFQGTYVRIGLTTDADSLQRANYYGQHVFHGHTHLGTLTITGAFGTLANKRTMKIGANNVVEFEDAQIEQDSGFAKVKAGQRLLADNCTVTGSMKIAEDTPTGAAMNLQNGLGSSGYTTTNKSQIMFGFNGGGTYPHYIKSSHQSNTGAAEQDAGSKLDFLINDGEADVGSATAIEAHTPKVLSISSQSVRCHKELRPDAGILMPFGSLGYNLVHQCLPHSVIGTSHQLFVRFTAQPASASSAAGQEHKTLQPHKGSYSAFHTITDGTFNGAVNATDIDDKTNSGGGTVSISYGHSDVTDGTHFVSSFAGYIYWGTGWATAVQNADNRMVRVSVVSVEGLNLYCDGKLVVAQAKETSNNISGAGANTRYYTFTARGSYTALEGHCTTDDTNMVATMGFTCFSYW